MANLAMVATQAQRDDAIVFPLLRAVESYLNISNLMPAIRLHWSRLLGRPMMESVAVADYVRGDEIGPVFIEEIFGKICTAHYRHLDGNGHRDWYTKVPGLTVAGNRAQCWQMRVVDPLHQDAQFEFDWRVRYGQSWPLVAPGTSHPALARLYERYTAFYDSWLDHIQERENTTCGLGEDEDMSDDGGMLE